jgi:hypothetical protein
MATSDKKPKKLGPTILPTGFGIRVTDKKIYVLDFMDTDYESNATIIGSYAMDEETVKMLVRKLTQAIEDVRKKKDE